MSLGVDLKCKKCGYKKSFYFGDGGISMRLLYSAQIADGEMGDDLQNIYNEKKSMYVDDNLKLYRCNNCNNLQNEMALSVYVEGSDGASLQIGYLKEIDHINGCRWIKQNKHICNRCNHNMDEVDETKIDYFDDFKEYVPCPKCGEVLTPVGVFLWDR